MCVGVQSCACVSIAPLLIQYRVVSWPFLIGRVTCLSDLVSVRAVKKKEREKLKEKGDM